MAAFSLIITLPAAFLATGGRGLPTGVGDGGGGDGTRGRLTTAARLARTGTTAVAGSKEPRRPKGVVKLLSRLIAIAIALISAEISGIWLISNLDLRH